MNNARTKASKATLPPPARAIEGSDSVIVSDSKLLPLADMLNEHNTTNLYNFMSKLGFSFSFMFDDIFLMKYAPILPASRAIKTSAYDDIAKNPSEAINYLKLYIAWVFGSRYPGNFCTDMKTCTLQAIKEKVKQVESENSARPRHF